MFAHDAKRFPANTTGTGGNGAALLFVNADPEQEYEIHLSAAPGLMAPRVEYELRGASNDGDFASSQVSLNGRLPLALGPNNEMPDLSGKLVNSTTGAQGIRVKPRTILFVELPEAQVY